MTYNIRGTKGMDNRRSARRIADVVRESQAQIVCLQEVHQRLPYSRMIDQPKVLARYLGMNVEFGVNLRIGIGNYGNALLNIAVTRTENHGLTSKGEPRGALEVGLLTPDGPLTVFCTHFGLNDEERAKQGQELAEWVNAAPKPVVVCGDFNEESGAAGIAGLIASAGLIDAYAGGPPTFEAGHPTSRIDFVLHDPSVKVESISLIDTLASDHLPIVADLELA
jgi:endonuclease/exonuclease/phosphatase family metal-dependent hydrolase